MNNRTPQKSIYTPGSGGRRYLADIAHAIKRASMVPVRAMRSNEKFRQTLRSELKETGQDISLVLQRTPIVVRHVVRRRQASLDKLIANILRPYRKNQEARRISEIVVRETVPFHIVTCGRNTGKTILKCLDSVYKQDFDRSCVKHHLVDDASNNGTADLVESWLQAHPDHCVEFHRTEHRKGGTANTRDGFRAANPKSVVIELNADDWLADEHVLSYLNRVYNDPEVWMTYNSFQFPNGAPSKHGRPYPRRVVKRSSYRDYEWICQHLHSFRAALLRHLPDSVFLDPETGDFFSSADDRSIYWSLLELCGPHAVHLERIMYVYNFHEQSDFKLDLAGSVANARKIQLMERMSPLDSLEVRNHMRADG